MIEWYKEVAKHTSSARAATACAGNWQRWDSFGWGSTKPKHRPQDCAIIYLSTRDSRSLDLSNEQAILATLAPALGSIDDGDMVEEDSHNHWAVGHVNGIVIRCIDERGEPTWAFEKLYELALKLYNYPMLNEEDVIKREHHEANEVWQHCYTNKDRIAYMRRHRNDFDLRCMSEVLAVAKGKYFAGDARGLLG